MENFVDGLSHVAGQTIEGREQLFALGLENLIAVLEARDLPRGAPRTAASYCSGLAASCEPWRSTTIFSIRPSAGSLG